MSNVIDFDAFKRRKLGMPPVASKYETMDKLQLLELMVEFKDKKSKGHILNKEEMLDAIALFRVLSVRAESDEMKEFAKSYFNHLTYEYKDAYPVA